jgi:hypothetical protein
MAAVDHHPAREDLEAFALGRLADDREATVEGHVGHCPACQQVLEQVPGDTLVELLRSAGSPPETLKAANGGVTTADTPAPPAGAVASITCAWTSEAPGTSSEPPAVLAGHPRYQPTRLLGGGMGAVWLAEHRVMGRKVAVKVIRPEFVAKAGAAERFRREVHAAARLQHRNIVTAFDAEQAGDWRWSTSRASPSPSCCASAARYRWPRRATPSIRLPWGCNTPSSAA